MSEQRYWAEGHTDPGGIDWGFVNDRTRDDGISECVCNSLPQAEKIAAALNAAEENQRPAALTPEMLGEEDRLRLSFLRNAGISKRLEIRRAMQVECDDRVQDSLTEMLGYHEKSIAWADRLLGSAD